MALPKGRDFSAEAELGGNAHRVSLHLPEQARPRNSIQFQPTFTEEDDHEEITPPEDFLMDRMARRPRSMSHHLQSTMVPSRRVLTYKARFWRALMSLGMTFHDFAPPPKPPKPSFVRKISTDTIPIELYFYLPDNYHRKSKMRSNYRFPIVVNFHGGGFCLGHATDDRYWARVVLQETTAVFVSVGYRRAPEHPFPIPVDDCVEALLYLQSHAEDLHLDPSQMALSGFSAGANLAFTVPFRLTYQYEKQASTEDLTIPARHNSSNWVPFPAEADSPVDTVDTANTADPEAQTQPHSRHQQHLQVPGTSETELDQLKPLHPKPHQTTSPFSSQIHLSATNTNDHNPNGSTTNLLNIPGPRSRLLRTLTHESLRPPTSRSNTQHNLHDLRERDITTPKTEHTADTYSLNHSLPPDDSDTTPQIRIVSIVAFYPLLDWTTSRSSKKRGSRNPQKTLPKVFSDLFDFSYLPAPDIEGYHCSPYASPALAPDHMIRDGLPNRVQMWLCEWDMLLAEGENFAAKMQGLGKDVKQEIVQGVPHGWDKSPNPWRDQNRIDEIYGRASRYLTRVFGEANRRATIGEGIGLGGMR